MYVLAGDIGGTQTRLCLLELTQDTADAHELARQSFSSQSYTDISEIIQRFLQDQQHSAQDLHAACFAVAGPVQQQQSKITNLPWVLHAQTLSDQLHGTQVRLINDFEAVAYGSDLLQPDDMHVLQQGETEQHGVCLFLGAGTGLGHAQKVWCQDKYIVLPSEGGHAGFAPSTTLQLELMQFYLQQGERVSIESLLSGNGLVRIYRFLRDTGRLEESQVLHEALSQEHTDAPAIISEIALGHQDPLALAALQCFVAIYGSHAGDMALSCAATGGVYVAGGIAPKLIELLDSDDFMQAFHNKPPMQELLQRIPLKVIMNPDTGLLGACTLALQLARAD